MAGFDLAPYQTRAKAAHDRYLAAVQKAREDTYLLPAGRASKLAQLREEYNTAVATIKADAVTALEAARAAAQKRAATVEARDAQTEVDLIGKLQPAFVLVLTEELRHMAPSQLVARWQASTYHSEQAAIAKLGTAALMASPKSPGDLTLNEQHALTQWYRLTAPTPTPEAVAVTGELNALAVAGTQLAGLDPVGRVETLRQQFNI